MKQPSPASGLGAAIRRLVLTMCLGAALAAGVGCRRSSAPAEDRGPARPRVALVMKSLANEFFQTMEQGARRHHAAHDGEYDLVVNGIKDEQDIARQIDLVAQMVARGVDALVLAPADSRALISAVKRAVAAGVVVINIDNRLDPQILAEHKLKIPFVGPDNRAGARQVGAHLAKHLAPGDPVIILEGLPTAENAVHRRAGFEEAIQVAGLKVVASQAANWEMNKANQIMAALLTEHPGVKGVLCANDSMALGAVAALRAAGRLGEVKVVGFDNISAARDLVRQGQMLATADQHADQLAVFGIEHALHLLRTKSPPADKETPVDLVAAAR